MDHIVDILLVGLALIIAAVYLYKTFKKTKSGCGSGVCHGCPNQCPSKAKQFKILK